MRALAFAVAVCVLTLGGARAETPSDEQMRCPIGGERFTYQDYAAYSTYGQRLDGKPFGSTEFPLRLPVCPNGFVVYRDDFSEAELAALTAFMQTPAYRELTANHTTYYRAAHLARAAGAPLEHQAWLTLRASWQVDRDAARFAAYQTEFLTLADATIAEIPRTAPGWWMLHFRAANAQRQLGQFEAAAARIAALPLNELGAIQLGEGGDVAEWGEGFRDGLARLSALIAARDASVEPARD